MKKFFTSTFPNFMAHETLYICFPWYNTHLGFVPNTSLWTFSIYFLLIPPYFVDFCMLNADVNVNKINNKIIGRKCKQIYDIRISKDIMAKDSETIKKKRKHILLQFNQIFRIPPAPWVLVWPKHSIVFFCELTLLILSYL